MTIRAPLLTRIGPREQPTELLTWTHGVQQGLQPTPFIQRRSDWQNPVLPVPNLALRTWTNGLVPGAIALTLPKRGMGAEPNPNPAIANRDVLTWTRGPQIVAAVVVPPFKQTEWPNPLAGAINHELRTWTQAPLIANIGAPLRNSDRPNPAPLPPNLELRTWLNGLPPGVVANPVPPLGRTWTTPAPVAPVNVDALNWSAKPPPTVAVVAAPFAQMDWANPIQLAPNVSLRTFTSGPPPVSAAAPRNNWWDNPTIPPANLGLLGLRTFVGGLPPGVIGNPVPPISNIDWPVPQRTGQSYTWINAQQIVAATPAPFTQYDWPNPRTAAQGDSRLYTWSNGPLIANIGAPFSQGDWPNPKLAAARVDLLNWVTTPVSITPFINGQWDWPNPAQRAPNLELATWLNRPPYQIPSSALATVDITFGVSGVGATSTIGTVDITFGLAAATAAGATSSGGFFYDLDGYGDKRRRARRERDLEIAQAEAIPDQMDREIAVLLHTQSIKDAERQELLRLRGLAKHAPEIDHERVLAALAKARTAESLAAFEALAREIERMNDEEDFAVLLMIADD